MSVAPTQPHARTVEAAIQQLATGLAPALVRAHLAGRPSAVDALLAGAAATARSVLVPALAAPGLPVATEAPS